ncbi:MAG: radical SAM protein [Candidatus Hydrogenedentota bacterium]
MKLPLVKVNGRVTALYRRMVQMYAAIPYNLSRTGRSFPAWHYFFEITRRCNLRCKMCQYITWLENTPTKVQAEGELTTEEWLNVIDQTGRWSLITFTGGEVWVRKDFGQILDYACAKRRVHIISNATMLTEARARHSVELAPKRLGGKGLNFAGISIDGTRELHDEIRGQRGAFDKSMKGIRTLAETRREMGKSCPLIHINTVILKDNLEVLPEMPRVAAEAGAEVLNLLTEMRAHDLPGLGHADPGSFNQSDMAMPTIDVDRLDEVLKETMRVAEEVGIELRLPRTPYDELLTYHEHGYDLTNYECRAVWTNLYVGAKGGVYPCFIQKVGNVRENTLREIWNNPAMQQFRRRRREGGFAVCQGCCELEHKGYAPEAVRSQQPQETQQQSVHAK